MSSGCPAINLDTFQLQLIAIYGEGLSTEELGRWLEEEHRVKKSISTIKRRLRISYAAWLI
jgi:hypothetical protein